MTNRSWMLLSKADADASSLSGEPGVVVLHHHVFGSSKHVLKGNDGVMIDDRVVPATLAAFCNCDGVEVLVLVCDWPWPHCERERWASFGSFN